MLETSEKLDNDKGKGKSRKGKDDFKICEWTSRRDTGKIVQEVSIITICLYRAVIASTSFDFIFNLLKFRRLIVMNQNAFVLHTSNQNLKL